MHSYNRSQIREGMDALDRDGEKIGKVGESMGRYFNVDAGFLGMKEYYVPFDSVRDIRDNAVYLDTRKDELDDMGWNERPDDTTDYDDDGTARREGERSGDTLQLREEELAARTRSVETGRAQFGKDVVEEQRSVDVPVTREEVVVERRPVDRRPADSPIRGSESESIDVPVREEHVEVEKRPVVYEEVEVGKRATQETRQVSDTVRREELRRDEDGDVDVRDVDRRKD